MASRCPGCGARIASMFAVDCEDCGTRLRQPTVLGIPIRGKRRRSAV
jgi:hypothetical protein